MLDLFPGCRDFEKRLRNCAHDASLIDELMNEFACVLDLEAIKKDTQEANRYHCRFEVRPVPETKEPPRRGRAASPCQFQLWFDRERDRAYRREPEVPALVFDKADKTIVPKATALLLARWEKAFREGVKWRYENAAQERQRAIRAAEEAARQERERLAAEARALLHKRQRLMAQASVTDRHIGATA